MNSSIVEGASRQHRARHPWTTTWLHVNSQTLRCGVSKLTDDALRNQIRNLWQDLG